MITGQEPWDKSGLSNQSACYHSIKFCLYSVSVPVDVFSVHSSDRILGQVIMVFKVPPTYLPQPATGRHQSKRLQLHQ